MGSEPHQFSRLAETLFGEFRGIPDTTPAGMRRRPMKNIKDLVEKILVENRVGQEGPEHTIRAAWPELVGPANAHYSHPVTIDPKGRLLVLVAHAVVKNELFHSRKMIAERIRALPGCGAVQDITLKVG